MEVRMTVIHVRSRDCIQHSSYSRALGGRNFTNLGFPSNHKGDVFAFSRILPVKQPQIISQSESQGPVRAFRCIGNVLHGDVGMPAFCIGRQVRWPKVGSIYLQCCIGGYPIHVEPVRFQLIRYSFIVDIICYRIRSNAKKEEDWLSLAVLAPLMEMAGAARDDPSRLTTSVKE